MVVFNELRISDDKKSLIVDCNIEGLKVYDNMYIQSVTVYHYKNASNCGLPLDQDKVITMLDNDENTSLQSFRGCVSKEQIKSIGVDGFEVEMFLVKVKCAGNMGIEVVLYPCGTDNTVDIAVVPDWEFLYSTGMRYVARFAGKCGDPCEIPDGFNNFVMLWFALKLAFETSDYAQMFALWDKIRALRFVDPNGSVFTATSGCGCK